MYIPTTAELREAVHLIVSLYRKDAPYFRASSCLNDHLARLGVLPIKPGYQPMIDFATPIVTAYNNKLAGKTVDIGRVTINVSMFDEKMAELSDFLDTQEALTRTLIGNDPKTLKYLYFTDRSALKKGTEAEVSSKMDNWVLRLVDYPILAPVLTNVKLWVNDLKTCHTTKDSKKTIVFDDRTSLDDLKDLAFDALIQNFGTLLTLHSGELSKLLDCYNANLLKHDKSTPEKYKINQFPVNITPGVITTSIEGVYVPKGAVVFDNSKNSSDAWVWLSMVLPTGKADYAILVKANSIAEIAVPVLGPKYAKYLNVMFVDITLAGRLKITAKKKK